MALSSKDIIEEAVNKLNLREYKETKDWIEQFKKLPKSTQIKVMGDFNNVQAIFIKEMMGKQARPIKLPNLGSFYYKDTRKEIYDLKANNPNLTMQEVIEIAKARHMERIEKKENIKKVIKSKSVVLNVLK